MNEPKIDIGYYDTKILYEGCMMYAKTAPTREEADYAMLLAKQFYDIIEYEKTHGNVPSPDA